MKKEKVNNFNEGMISVQPPFSAHSERGSWQGWNTDVSPAACHYSSLLQLDVPAPGKEEKMLKMGENEGGIRGGEDESKTNFVFCSLSCNVKKKQCGCYMSRFIQFLRLESCFSS